MRAFALVLSIYWPAEVALEPVHEWHAADAAGRPFASRAACMAFARERAAAFPAARLVRRDCSAAPSAADAELR